MKKCPFCSEEIQDDAIKCKHCGADSIDWQTKLGKIWNEYRVYIICIPIIIIAAGFLFMSQKPNFNKSAKQGKEIAPPSVETRLPAPPLVLSTPIIPVAEHAPTKRNWEKEFGGDPYKAIASLSDEKFKKLVDDHPEIPGLGYTINREGRMTRMIEKPTENEGGIDLSQVPLAYLPQIIHAQAGRSRTGQSDKIQAAERQQQEAGYKMQEAERKQQEAEMRQQAAERKIQAAERQQQEAGYKMQEAERKQRQAEMNQQEAERKQREAEWDAQRKQQEAQRHQQYGW
jgi:hypothetical protein